MSCLIRETLAASGADGERHALSIVDAKLLAGVLAKIKLCQIAVKVLDINVLVDADKAALQDAEKTLQRVRVLWERYKQGAIEAAAGIS
jgi:hypothetical protein